MDETICCKLLQMGGGILKNWGLLGRTHVLEWNETNVSTKKSDIKRCFVIRIVTALLISHYIPVTLFTVASFTSFSLALNRGNDRIGFLVTLFLVLVSMNISITNTSPGGNMITSVGKFFFTQVYLACVILSKISLDCLS